MKMSTITQITYERNNGFLLSGEDTFHCSEPEPNECCWVCPQGLGDGCFHRISIRPGFEIWISDCNFKQEAMFKHHMLPPVLQFSFILSGHYHVNYDGDTTPTVYRGEHQGIIYFNGTNATCRVLSDMPIQNVSIMVYPEFFCAYFEEHLKLMPPTLRNALENNVDNGYQYTDRITPQMRSAIQQIINCPFHGVMRKLFLESRALELLSYQLGQLIAPRLQCPLLARMHPQDRRQTEFARNFLINNLETPPCLEDLARSAGMSHPKLNRCFKQLYGMTVFQYLRSERLNKARDMLEREGFTVTETAFQVGYDSLSHFSQAYKKQFGTSPSHCLKVA